MLPVIKPPRLNQGDTIGIIAPASPLPEQEYLLRGTQFLHNLGYQVRTGNNVNYKSSSYLAGSDDERLSELHRMFYDPEIKAVICIRGGYGSLRLLQDIDYKLIKNHPKILVGYSDITALHLAIQKKTGLVTFHGPMLYPELGSKDLPQYTKMSFYYAITATVPLKGITSPPDLPPPRTITSGKAEGIITGGNLSLIVSTLGTPFEIDTSKKILFLEEVDEAPYHLDRMLTQLKLAGKLEAAAGIVFGYCSRCNDPKNKISHLEVIIEHLAPLGIPSYYGLPAGHIPIQATLPFGIRARLDAVNKVLSYLETATV